MGEKPDDSKYEDTSMESEPQEWSQVALLRDGSPQRKTENRGRTAVVWMQGILIIVLLVTNVVALQLLLRSQHAYERSLAAALAHGSSSHHQDVLETSHTRFKTFTEALTLSGTGPEAQKAWDKLLATGGTNDDYRIERGIMWTYLNETQGIPYSISMWHGLHCLNMIHKRLFDPPEEWAAYSATFSNASFHTGHLPHCFGYLAQHILCAGDTILEKPDLVWGENGRDLMRFSVTGFGTAHQCRDLDQAMNIVKKIEARNRPLPALQWQEGDTLEGVYGHLLKE